MKTTLKKTIWGLISFLTISFNALADDTELYLGTASTTGSVKPNILFIVDTSGSMRTLMNITVPITTVTTTTTSLTGKFTHQFTSDEESWSGLGSEITYDSTNERILILRDETTEQTYSFAELGDDHAGETVTVTLEMTTTGGWETGGWSKDYFQVSANGSVVSRASYANGATFNISFEVTLDGDGKVKLEMKPDTTYGAEAAYVDNITLALGTLTFGYDSTKTYPGCHDASKTYFSSLIDHLICSGTTYQTQWYNIADNKCDALATKINSFGYGTAIKAAYWRTPDLYWDTLNPNHSGLYQLECEQDSGIHGETTASSFTYAADGAVNPWVSASAQEINWTAFPAQNHYSGNYLNYYECTMSAGCSTAGETTETVNQTVTRTRLEVAQYVLNDIVNTTSNVNIGLMRFERNSNGGYIVTAMDDIDNNNTAFKTELDKMDDGGYTPLAESLYESYLYYLGATWLHGASPDGNSYVPDATDPLAHTAGIYNSPIDFQCQKSFVVLLTDGDPSVDTGDDSRIEAIPGFQTITGASSCSGNCLDELAQVMFEKDMSTTFLRDQNVSTYTIAMGNGISGDALALLQATATKGGGKYFTADDYQALLSAFSNIISEIQSVNSTFTSPAISVNAFNRTTHRSELYYSLFKPEHGPHWPGNLKKFKLAFENGEGKIVDANDVDAVDPKTGFFFEEAQSYWPTVTQSPDGGDVHKGGAAAKVIKDRIVYTNIDSNEITSTANRVQKSNNVALQAKINSTLSTTEIDTIIDWVRGWDVKNENGLGVTEPRMEMGDPLHSRPVVIQHGGTIAVPILTIYTTNNDGFLNAVDEATGETLYTFIPEALLSNLDELFTDDASVARPYGLDGAISATVTDENKNGIIDGDDKATIYIGMRRGGSNYYSIDVTNRTVPKINWVIKGGVTGDYLEMGQTWSAPVIKEMTIDGALKEVMIVGGGYDTTQDSNNVHTDDSKGRAIYIIDTSDGSRIWWAGPTGSGADLELATLTNSIPSEILAAELQKDKGVTRLYFTDTRGQVFRIDIDVANNTATSTPLVSTAYRIAKLSEEGVTAGTRRTYYRPDAAFMEGYIGLIIGTGYRSHPLEISEQNRIYMIKDENIYDSPATTPTTITDTDLVDVAVLPSTDAAIATRASDLAGAKGWYFDLAAKEKVLARPLIINGIAILTSFTPNTGTTVASCSPGSGGASVYYLDLGTADPIGDLDNDGSTTAADRSKELKRAGIPPSPTLMVTKEGTVGLAGLDVINIPGDSGLEKTYWYEDKSGSYSHETTTPPVN